MDPLPPLNKIYQMLQQTKEEKLTFVERGTNTKEGNQPRQKPPQRETKEEKLKKY